MNKTIPERYDDFREVITRLKSSLKTPSEETLAIFAELETKLSAFESQLRLKRQEDDARQSASPEWIANTEID